MSKKRRTSAFERLKDLPEVFTLKTVASVLDCDPRMASTYIGRWKESGMVRSLGPRTGVHFNLVNNPEADSELRMEAIALLFPGAMIGGVSAVHAAGWTTQIPRQAEIIIPDRRSFPQVDDAEISVRPLKWIREARRRSETGGPVRYVDPAFALADCLASGIWSPDPDDIEWDEVVPEQLADAFNWFDIEMPAEWHDELEYASRAGPGNSI